MLRDKARLLIGKAQSVEQGRERMRMIQDAKAALDEVLKHRRVPAARGIARSLRAGFDQGGPRTSLGLGQLAGAARGALVAETGEVLHQKEVAVIAHGL